MNKTIRLLGGVVTLFATMTAGLVQAQQNFDDVKVETVPVRGGLHMLLGSGGNLGVLSGDDGVIVIDDQYAPLSGRLLAAIRAISDKPIRFVVNTHWHMDHSGGNANFAREGAVLVAQDNVRTRMASGQFMSFMQRQIEAAEPAALPVISFNEQMHFYLNGQDMHVIHVPHAHTDGDAVVHFPGLDAFHLGDTYFAHMYPFIDGDSGGSAAGMIAAADSVLPRMGEASQVIPGHGPLSNRAEYRAWRDMLAAVTARIEKQIAAGATREAVIAAKPTAEFDATYGGGFMTPDLFSGLLYDLLSAHGAAR